MTPTRILIISDTHEGSSNPWPYTASQPAPRVDVLLHCGDLTHIGGLPAFKKAMSHILALEAELKLVIAGNHDLELDEAWVRAHPEEVTLEEHRECIACMKSLEGKGVFYLEEGRYEFTLRDGRRIIVWASPYTPAFNDFAFAYDEGEDRFNEGQKKILEDVDIVMTHGPPAFPNMLGYTLDQAADGRHCGCEMLARAVARVRPRLHCFGHIHEGRGATTIHWVDGTLEEVESVRKPEADVLNMKKGMQSETILVNGAMFDEGKGFLVDLDLNKL